MIIRYNCWKYDYYDEPLVAIVATLFETIEKKTKLLDEKNTEQIKGVLKSVGATLLTMANKAVKEKTGVDTAVLFEHIQKGIEYSEESYSALHEYDVYFGFNQTLKGLQDALNELSEHYTIVFLIDELDRCLPEYSIKVLERLHHLIENTKNIISVIATDKTQLQKSISHIFGFDNPEIYLKKFIQFTVPLSIGEVSDKFMDKYCDYIDLFDKDIFKFSESVEECIQEIFKEIDVRTQEQIMERVKLAHTILFTEPKDYTFMCMEILITTLICYYGNNLKEPNDHFVYDMDLLFAKGKNSPPAFTEFFKNSIEKHVSCVNNYLDSGRYYLLPAYESLYGAIFYSWTLICTKSRTVMCVERRSNNDCYQIVIDNISDYKKFIDTIYIIK